ncbi:MAG: hypothetical protein O7F71_05350 [Gammaproteobacteria bacterium]|nr:hypothetical protein [Gammaproteobacteria bacterium]
MKAVFQVFWHICLLRQSPEYVPTRAWFIVTIIAANVFCEMLLSLTINAELDVLRAVTGSVVYLSSTAALVWLALQLRTHVERFTATITALFGCDLIITVSFALLRPLADLLYSGAANTLFPLFLIWTVSVAGFILHRALNTHYILGIGVALGIAIMSVALSQLSIGAP